MKKVKECKSLAKRFLFVCLLVSLQSHFCFYRWQSLRQKKQKQLTNYVVNEIFEICKSPILRIFVSKICPIFQNHATGKGTETNDENITKAFSLRLLLFLPTQFDYRPDSIIWARQEAEQILSDTYRQISRQVFSTFTLFDKM